MAHRFYVPTERISEGEVTFTEDQRKQIKNVLRLRAGEAVKVFDGSGSEYTASIRSLDGNAIADIIDTTAPSTEPSLHLTLVQSLPKGEKIELILQKCTEIGVSKFLIVETARSVPKIDSCKLPARLARWRTIVKEAAEQSGRVRLPTVDGVVSFKEALAITKERTHRLIAWEEEKNVDFASTLQGIGNTSDMTLFIGPEGGFRPDEISVAAGEGVIPVSLGSRILRTETAAIVGSALLIYNLEKKSDTP